MNVLGGSRRPVSNTQYPMDDTQLSSFLLCHHNNVTVTKIKQMSVLLRRNYSNAKSCVLLYLLMYPCTTYTDFISGSGLVTKNRTIEMYFSFVYPRMKAFENIA